MRALADPTRRRLVEILARGPRSSGELAEQFEVSAPAISQHLKTLRQAGLVKVRPEAQRRIYELEPMGMLELVAWVDQMRAFWVPRLDALEDALKRKESS
ncbi:MAG: ArsR/SmtB family transcription factor [Vulcanimicrobiota bacterium]